MLQSQTECCDSVHHKYECVGHCVRICACQPCVCVCGGGGGGEDGVGGGNEGGRPPVCVCLNVMQDLKDTWTRGLPCRCLPNHCHVDNQVSCTCFVISTDPSWRTFTCFQHDCDRKRKVCVCVCGGGGGGGRGAHTHTRVHARTDTDTHTHTHTHTHTYNNI